MREIKFRLWTQDFSTEDNNKRIMTETFGIYQAGAIVNPWSEEILMQYAGLKDKNGKDIYEGDIVKNEFLSVNKVIFADGGFKMTSGTSVGNYLSYFGENIEIIGNIYENPNLLSTQPSQE